MVLAPPPAQAAVERAGASADAGPLRVLGNLPEPAYGSQRKSAGSIAAVDSVRRRMYYTYPDPNDFVHVVTYDLRPTLPRPVAEGRLLPGANLPTPSPYNVALDDQRSQLLFLTANLDVGGTTVTSGNPSITLYDTTSNQVVLKQDFAQILPGFMPFGATYSRADDRYYLLGEFSGTIYGANSTFTGGIKMVSPVATVLALEPGTGRLIWARPVPQCQQALFTRDVGGMLARMSFQPALAFACTTGGAGGGTKFPGQAGLVTLHIDPKAPDSAAASAFAVEFFPIAGTYSTGVKTGVAAYDRVRDRFYLQSMSTATPGDWVFDERLAAWVGFAAADFWSDEYVGFNEGLGHLYIGTNGGGEPAKTDGLLVVDARQTPVPAGSFVQLLVGSFIATDSGSRRMFFNPNVADYKGTNVVVEDLTPVTAGAAPVDYDADTTDTPDVGSAYVSYAGGAAGFGAESVQVGGTGAASSDTGPLPPPAAPGVGGGTRAVMSARLGGLDLRPAGATASAQGRLADLNTMNEYQTRGAGDWRYPVMSCLDSGDGVPPQSTSADGNTASVSCDLAGARVSADATAGEAGSGAAVVNHASYRASSRRDRASGVTVSTAATASGSRFQLPDGLTLSVGAVQADSTSSAHGRPGTARASWSRTVDGVRLYDGTGTTLLTLPGCASSVTSVAGSSVAKVVDSCQALARSVNDVVQNRMRLTFPLPRLTVTPKGAYAAIDGSEADYYQQRTMNDQGVIYQGDSVGLRPVPAMITEVFNDATERSRTVTVLAATQSSAIFTVSPTAPSSPWGAPLPTAGADTPPGSPRDGTVTAPGSGSSPTGLVSGVADPVLAGGSVDSVNVLAPSMTGYLFLHRSVRDALLLGALVALMLAGCATAWRRRQLINVLTTVGKENLL